MNLQQRVTEAFTAHYGESPTLIVRAPGRVNLIGEHTDYNDGFVLPMAIDRAVWIALRPRTDGYVVAHSLEFNDRAEFSLSEMTRRHGEWAEYIKGVAWALQEAGYDLIGWEGVLASDVPIGASLSSSAAFELAAARAFATLSDIPWDAAVMAKFCQKAENQWVGVNSGIMDQMISAAGREGEALLIDCRDLGLRSVPLPPETAVVIMDTMTRRELVNSGYNVRRRECEIARDTIGVPALRDATMDMLDEARPRLDAAVAAAIVLTPDLDTDSDKVYRRARHIITENARTTAAADVMDAGDAAAMGLLMNASHASLHADFEVTNKETNLMAVLAQPIAGCYGARMTGGGFGGCTVALVRADAAESFSAAVAAAYQEATGIAPVIYVCQASAGAQVITG